MPTHLTIIREKGGKITSTESYSKPVIHGTVNAVNAVNAYDHFVDCILETPKCVKRKVQRFDKESKWQMYKQR